MSIEVREQKWKKTVSNKRIVIGKIQEVNEPSINDISAEMGMKDNAGYASKRPKQGRRM